MKHSFFTLLLLICFSIPLIATGGVSAVPFVDIPFDVNNIPEPVPPPKEVRDFFQLDPFYQQWIDVEGLPVVASAKVNPYALKEAAWLIWQMIGHRSDVLQAIAQNGGRVIITGYTEMFTDIPEYSHRRPAFYWDRRRRGLGEENLLGYPGDTTLTGYQLIHQFAHTVHLIGLKIVDPTFDNRLNIAYEAAMAQRLWQGTYSATNREEYWAQGVSWYLLNENRRQDNTINTRTELKSYDPALAALITEIYGDSGWQYTSLTARAHLPHLQGFNPQDSPAFEWPEDVEKAYAQLMDPHSSGGDEWINLGLYHPNQLSQLNSSRARGKRTEVLFVNPTEVDVLVYQVHPDGMETFRKRISAKRRHAEFFSTHAGNIFFVKDFNGKALALFRAAEQTGRVLIDTAPTFVMPGLSKISGDNQTSVSGSALANAFIIEVRDDNLSVLEGIPVTFTVTAGDGTLSVTRTMTDENGRAQSTLTLGANLGTNTVSVSAAGIEGTVTFNAVVEAAVDIPDSNFRAAVESALGKASGASITAGDMVTLTNLEARNVNISNLTGLEYATKLTKLSLGGNSISDISPLSDLTQLTRLSLWANSISNISPVAALTNLTDLNLSGNAISSIAAVAGLTQLTWLHIQSNSISDITPLADLTNLMALRLDRNSISDIAALSGLTQLTELRLDRNNITDLSPLVANTGLGEGDRVDVSENPLNSASINVHILALQSRGVEVRFENLKPTTLEYLLSIPAGTSLIHVPLQVTAVDGVAKPIDSISDLYDALGGANVVNFLITYDSQAGQWLTYFGPTDSGTLSDSVVINDTGIIAGLTTAVSVQLSGKSLRRAGHSIISLSPGLNLVGLPLRDLRINRVSDLFTLDGIGGNVPVIILTDNGEFGSVGQAGDPFDIPIIGGQGFILTAQQPATVLISGEAWSNVSDGAAAPLVTRKGIVGDTTAVLVLRGAVIDERTGLPQTSLRVSVKNLSTGRAVATITDDRADYRLTAVDIETGRAAAIGDTLEISAQSPDPFIGVKPLRYTVTAEDVRHSLIQLPELVAYEIPTETQLLANYPNPFNPETWIPYRLAEDALVTLTIYGSTGQVVRTINVGHQIAAVYERRSKAIYWDGRNEFGEQVASGVFFYHLSAGDFSATRKMLVLK